MPKAFDIVVNPVGSGFAKALQQQLKKTTVNNIYRRLTPKTVPARRTIISRKGNVLRRGADSYVRDHFSVTQKTLNKVEQFERFRDQGVASPQFATTVERAKALGVKTLFARTLINATNGRGIVEFEAREQQYPAAPLYTEYIPKKAEYRFHVFGDKVIDVQEKRKKRGYDDDRNTRVRNVANGYVYCRDNISIPAGADTLAINAVKALGYSYGAVDLIYNEKRNQCYVLEVNSRPGLMGTTLEKYGDAIIEQFNLDKR